MEQFKKAMGFPILERFVLAVPIDASLSPKDVFWFGVFLVALSCGLGLGQFVQRARNGAGPVSGRRAPFGSPAQ